MPLALGLSSLSNPDLAVLDVLNKYSHDNDSEGTLSISPLRYGSKILDRAALAGLLVVLVAFLDCQNLILAKSHYLMYCLALAMEPRWLVTLDENLQVCICNFSCRNRKTM